MIDTWFSLDYLWKNIAFVLHASASKLLLFSGYVRDGSKISYWGGGIIIILKLCVGTFIKTFQRVIFSLSARD